MLNTRILDELKAMIPRKPGKGNALFEDTPADAPSGAAMRER
jgi:hypothetical protein